MTNPTKVDPGRMGDAIDSDDPMETDDLHGDDVPQWMQWFWYHSGIQRFLGSPLIGGISLGQVRVGADSQSRHWQMCS